MTASTGAIDALVSRLRREAYTGPNRCWPCTALNGGLLAFLSAIAAVLLTPLVGFVAFLGGLAMIWLRGYLVPYTPRLTPRLLAAVPGRRAPPRGLGGVDSARPDDSRPDDGRDSGKGNRRGGGGSGHGHGEGGEGGANGETPTDILGDLLRADVLAEDERGVTLRPAFRERWRAEMTEVRAMNGDDLAAAVRAAVPWVAEASVVTEGDRYWIVLSDEDDRIANETWLAPPAAVGDLAAIRALAARTDFTPRQRTSAAPPLRQLLDLCPVCDATLEVTSPHTCCGSPRSVARGIEAVLSCPDCDEVVAAIHGPDEEPP